MLIPSNTSLTLRRMGDDSGTTFLSEMLGPSRYGMTLTIPRIYDKYFPIPAGTEILCQFVDKGRLWQFQSYIMGYDQAVPPHMIVPAPTSLEEANRRGSLRFRVELPVNYLIEGPQLVGEQTRTHDVSLGGLCAVTGRILEPNTRIALTLELPDHVIQGDAVVRWSAFRGRTPLAGVQFEGIRGHGATALHKYLVALEREWAKVRTST